MTRRSPAPQSFSTVDPRLVHVLVSRLLHRTRSPSHVTRHRLLLETGHQECNRIRERHRRSSNRAVVRRRRCRTRVRRCRGLVSSSIGSAGPPMTRRSPAPVSRRRSAIVCTRARPRRCHRHSLAVARHASPSAPEDRSPGADESAERHRRSSNRAVVRRRRRTRVRR